MSEQSKDYSIGFIRVKPRWNVAEKKYVDSGLFEGFIYKHNKQTGEPEVSGTRKIMTTEGEKEVPVNPIEFSFTIAISSLTKVIAHESTRCNVYWSKTNNPEFRR